jgi:hypothetical protein
MHITYRPARPEDLEPATRIVQDAYNDLRVRHGLPPSIGLNPPLFQTFSLAEPSSSLWVAEADGTLQGFAFAWMRQRFWFLVQRPADVPTCEQARAPVTRDQPVRAGRLGKRE